MPALALAAALQRVSAQWEPVLVGAARGVERELLPTRGYRYHLLPAEPLYRRSWWRNGRWLVALPRLVVATRRVLRAERPVLVIGTGGYAAAPVVWGAGLAGIPTAIQEQNARPGLATKVLAKRVHQIHLGFEEARGHLRVGPGTEVYVSGTPILPPPEPAPDRARAKAALGIPADRPVVLVMGGSQGARAINTAVADCLAEGGLAGATLLWSTGPTHFARYASLHQPPDRFVRGFWDPLSDAYAVADLVVARAGAVTTAEICAWGLPAIYVPLPTAAADHQRLNAEALVAIGAAALLPESELTARRLAATIEAHLGDRNRLDKMRREATRRGHPKAAENAIQRMLTLVS